MPYPPKYWSIQDALSSTISAPLQACPQWVMPYNYTSLPPPQIKTCISLLQQQIT